MVNSEGYVANLLPKVTQFKANEDFGGTPTQMIIDFATFKPYDSFAGVYPTGLSATTSQNNQITVSWTAVGSGSPTNYIVWRSTQSGGPYTVAGNSTTTSFVDTSVGTGVNYYYILQAQNAGGVSLYSLNSGSPSGQVVGTAVGVPTAPTGVSAAIGINSSLLSWNNQVGVTGYYISRSTTSGAETAYAGTAGTASNYTDNVVTDGTLYYYKVAASNSFGMGAFSVEVSAVPAVTIFTNYLGLFNGQADMWTPLNTNCSATYVSSNDVFNSFYNAAGYMAPPPSGGVMDMNGEFCINAITNELNGVTKTLPYALNINGYQYLELDAVNLGNATNVWDNLGFGGVGEVRPMFQVNVGGNPTFEQGQNGRAFYEVINNGGDGGTNFVHWTIPLSLWSGPTNAGFGGFDLRTRRSCGAAAAPRRRRSPRERRRPRSPPGCQDGARPDLSWAPVHSRSRRRGYSDSSSTSRPTESQSWARPRGALTASAKVPPAFNEYPSST